MKYDPNESFDQWLERVAVHEKEKALRDIKKGIPVDTVLAELARRITEKGLHPIFKNLTDVKTNYDAEKSKAEYEERYISKRTQPPADHVTED